MKPAPNADAMQSPIQFAVSAGGEKKRMLALDRLLESAKRMRDSMAELNETMALKALTADAIRADWLCRRDERFTAAVVREVLADLPSREAIEHHGRETIKKNLKARVSTTLKRRKKEGVIVVGFFVTILFDVIVGVIVALLVRWLMDDPPRRRLIQQARGA